MLRPKDVCERLRVSYTTLRDYVKRGWVKLVILGSGMWRFRENADRLVASLSQE